MALNSAHANGGVLIHAGECILLFCDNVQMEFAGQVVKRRKILKFETLSFENFDHQMSGGSGVQRREERETLPDHAPDDLQQQEAGGRHEVVLLPIRHPQGCGAGAANLWS